MTGVRSDVGPLLGFSSGLSLGFRVERRTYSVYCDMYIYQDGKKRLWRCSVYVLRYAYIYEQGKR